MTSRDEIAKSIRSLYAARVKGDLLGTVKDMAADATFSFNGRGIRHPAMAEACCGKDAITATIKEFIDAWRFEKWEERALLIDGEKAALHWTAHVTCIPTNKAETLDVVDILTFRDGKIVEFHQSTDTALVKSLAS